MVQRDASSPLGTELVGGACGQGGTGRGFVAGLEAAAEF